MSIPAICGHKRPLPPPCSQSTVRQCSALITDWLPIDSKSELFMEGSSKRPKLLASQSGNLDVLTPGSASNPQAEGTPYSPRMQQTLDTAPESTNSSSTVHKQRLFNSFPSLPASRLSGTDRENDVDNRYKPQPQPKSPSPILFNEQEYCNSQSSPRLLADPSNAEEEADMLLRLTSIKTNVNAEPSAEDTNKEEEWRNNRRREEEMSRNRSRIMRQQNIANHLAKGIDKSREDDLPSLQKESGLSNRIEENVAETIPTPKRPSAVFEGKENLETSCCKSQSAPDQVARHSEEADLDANLDLCQDYCLGSKVKQDQRKVRSNPFSRSVAERYRTQDRHTAASKSFEDTVVDDVMTLSAGADRLRELTTLHKGKRPQVRQAIILNGTKRQGLSLNVSPPPDRGSATYDKAHSGYDATIMTPVERHVMIAESTAYKSNSSIPNPQAKPKAIQQATSGTLLTSETSEDTTQKTTEFTLESHPRSTISDPTSLCDSSKLVPNVALLEAWPAQGERGFAVSLPMNFDDMDVELQQITVEHERLKERKRDLVAAQTAMQGMAALWSVKPLDAKEREWMSLLKEFLQKVIQEERSGKRMRERLRTVSDSMQRRLLKRQKPNLAQVQSLLASLFNNDSFAIEVELSDIDEKIETVRKLRVQSRSEKGKEWKAMARRLRRKTQKRLEGKSSGNKSMQPCVEKLQSENRHHKSQCQSSGSRINALRTQLVQFSSPGRLDKEHEEQQSQYPSDQEVESETSEEDEGAAFCAGAGVAELTRTAQAADAELIEVNQRHAKQRSINEQQGVQRIDMSLASENILGAADLRHYNEHEATLERNESDFDDDDEESLSSDVAELGSVCHRYLVTEEYYNIDGFEDDSQMVNHKYLDVSKANLKVDELITNFITNYRNSDEYKTDRALRISRTDSIEGLRDCHVQLGSNDIGGCHIWVEKEEFSPGEEAYRNAKVRSACDANPVYWVLWKKTLEPLIGAEEAEEMLPVSQQSNEQRQELFHGNNSQVAATAEEQHYQNFSILDNEQTYHQGGDDEFYDELFGPDVDPAKGCLQQIPIMPAYLTFIAPTQDPMTSTWTTSATNLATTQPVIGGPTILASEPDPSVTESTKSTKNVIGAITESTFNRQKYPPSPPTTASSASVNNREMTQEIHFNNIQQFTTISMANRYAKDLFMEWYTIHLSSPEDQAFVRHEDCHMEDELKNYGNLSTWSREEEFIVDVSHGHAQSGDEGDLRQREHRAVEKYHVWVERKTVRGPAN